MSKPKNRDLGKKPAKQPVLVLTGELMAREIVIAMVDGEELRLTHCLYMALVALIVARLAGGTGRVSREPVDMSRLRKVLNRVRPGLGDQLVPWGTGGEYRFGMTADEIRSHVFLDPTFFELVDHGLVTPEQAEILRKACKLLKSKRNR
jgi:hypothetical protein